MKDILDSDFVEVAGREAAEPASEGVDASLPDGSTVYSSELTRSKACLRVASEAEGQGASNPAPNP